MIETLEGMQMCFPQYLFMSPAPKAQTHCWECYLKKRNQRFFFFPPIMYHLDCKKMKPVNPKGKPWIFIARTYPILWIPDMKSWLIGKNSDAGKDWGQEEKGMTEDEMVGWHHRLNGHEFEQALGDTEGQRSLACHSAWSCRVRHNLVTEQQQQGTA